VYQTSANPVKFFGDPFLFRFRYPDTLIPDGQSDVISVLSKAYRNFSFIYAVLYGIIEQVNNRLLNCFGIEIDARYILYIGYQFEFFKRIFEKVFG